MSPKWGQHCFYKNPQSRFYEHSSRVLTCNGHITFLFVRKAELLIIFSSNFCYSLMGLKITVGEKTEACNNSKLRFLNLIILLLKISHFPWFHSMLISSFAPHNSYPSYHKVSGSGFSHSTCTCPRSPAKENLSLCGLISRWLQEKFRTWENLPGIEYVWEHRRTEQEMRKLVKNCCETDHCLCKWIGWQQTWPRQLQTQTWLN